MYVIKRDGTKEKFNSNKIEEAIFKAFQACSKKISPTMLGKIREFIVLEFKNNGKEEIPVEDIQDKVEMFLCKECSFEVGKAYILYREQHKQARLIKGKLQYIHKYTESNDAATNLSNTDDNANSNIKNAATLEGELYKDISRIIQRSQMKELLMEIGSPYRDQSKTS